MEKFVSVKPLDSQLSPEQHVLKAQDYKRLVTYEQLLKELELKDKRREQELLAAKAAALRAGFKQGKEQANAELATQLLDFTVKMNHAVANMERQLVDVVIHAVRKIVHNFDDTELVTSAVERGMELVRGSQKLIIRVNPKLYSAVDAKINAFQDTSRQIEIVSDAHLKETECVLESDIGIVNASAEQQLEAITRALQRSFAEKSGRSH
ncbi:FliH/SctL family protein [Thiofilum flexile]|uniref:FliH/SctL family protein n=1 Tax=Thiofilum flexile TaxID=125627 RepID=UPI000381A148|nr:FliH/SctL family protein [Thiofilum flexile]